MVVTPDLRDHFRENVLYRRSRSVTELGWSAYRPNDEYRPVVRLDDYGDLLLYAMQRRGWRIVRQVDRAHRLPRRQTDWRRRTLGHSDYVHVSEGLPKSVPPRGEVLCTIVFLVLVFGSVSWSVDHITSRYRC